MTSTDTKSANRLQPLWEGRRLLLITGALLTLCLALLLLSPPRFIQQTELNCYDAMLSERASAPRTSVPVLVGIDEESLQAYGQWPWPRYRLASLVQRLQEMGAEVIALDFLMPEPDRTSPEVIRLERERDFRDAPLANQILQQDSNSQRLAEVLKRGKTVLSYYFRFAGEQAGEAGKPPLPPPGLTLETWTAAAAGWPRPSGLLRSMPVLRSATSAEGYINVQHDIDGVLRRVPLLMRYQGRYYPSLALQSVLLRSPGERLQLIHDRSGTALVWRKVHIPVDGSGDVLPDFRSGKRSFRYISAREVLGGGSSGSLSGKIAVVGVKAGGVADVHQVPSGLPLNGLEVQATVIDNILSGRFICRPDWGVSAETSAVILLGLLTTWLIAHSGFVLSLVTVLAGTGGCYLGGKELLHSWDIFLSPVMPMITPVVIMTVLSCLKYGIEARKVLQRNRDLFEAQDAIIISMSVLAETRDSDMGGHVLRTKHYVATLARHLATLPHYRELDEATIDLLAKSAPLHDVGKIGIPDSILLKAGRLTDEEYATMKSHTLIGASAITKAMKQSARPESLDFLNYARQMIESHHEKWDGSGYPYGLRGTMIPLAGRLMAVADVYDALVCKRVYKRSYSHAEAQDIILADSGSHFDPEVVAAFIAKINEFSEISEKFADEDTMAGERE
jgi:CHASE2 domain-containing sensor protein